MGKKYKSSYCNIYDNETMDFIDDYFVTYHSLKDLQKQIKDYMEVSVQHIDFMLEVDGKLVVTDVKDFNQLLHNKVYLHAYV